MNPIDDLNQLGYTSSQPDIDLAPVDVVKPQDEVDLPTLERVSRLIADRKTHYRSVDALSLAEDITVENQLIVNKKVLYHIQELELLINGTIAKVREKMNNERG